MPIIRVDITKASEQLIKGFSGLTEKKVSLSIMRSINAALGKTQTQMIRAVTDRYNLPRELFIKHLRTQAFKATPTNPYKGSIRYIPKQFSLSDFGARQIENGVATGRFGNNRSYASKRVKGLRANNKLVKSGVVVQILRGETKAIESAFLVFKSGTSNAPTRARGKYGRDFEFNNEQGAKTLNTVSMQSILRNEKINQVVSETAAREYSSILQKELSKRVKSIGEGNIRF